MIVMLPRDSMTESMIPPTVSASSGEPAPAWSMMNCRASPSPRKIEPRTTPSTRSWKTESTAKYAMLPAYCSAWWFMNPLTRPP